MSFVALPLLLLSSWSGAAWCVPFRDWQSRTIYQLLTDRFAKSPSSADPFAPCDDLSDYCGGTFAGVEAQLDYIAAMGFDALWISPIPTQTEGGYHGYWLRNLNTINAHFGSSAQLRALIDAAHRRDMLVMLDVVANHVGPVGNDFSQISPVSARATREPPNPTNQQTNKPINPSINQPSSTRRTSTTIAARVRRVAASPISTASRTKFCTVASTRCPT